MNCKNILFRKRTHCKQCGKPKPYPCSWRMICSPACWEAEKRSRRKFNTCVVCRSQIPLGLHKIKTCSDRCTEVLAGARKYPRCVICHKEKPPRPQCRWAKACSEECAEEMRRRWQVNYWRFYRKGKTDGQRSAATVTQAHRGPGGAGHVPPE